MHSKTNALKRCLHRLSKFKYIFMIKSNHSKIVTVRRSTRFAMPHFWRRSVVSQHLLLVEVLEDELLVELLDEPHGPAPAHGEAVEDRVNVLPRLHRLPLDRANAPGVQDMAGQCVEAEPSGQLVRRRTLPEAVLDVGLTDPEVLAAVGLHLELAHRGQRAHLTAGRDFEEDVYLTAVQDEPQHPTLLLHKKRSDTPSNLAGPRHHTTLPQLLNEGLVLVRLPQRRVRVWTYRGSVVVGLGHEFIIMQQPLVVILQKAAGRVT